MKILSLDMSTKATGWAIIDSCSKKFECGVIKIDDKKNNIEDRFHFMIEEINKLISSDIEDIVFEDVFLLNHNNPDVMKKLCILQGILICLAYNKKVNVHSIRAGEWRDLGGLHHSIFTCKKCGDSFEDISSLENPVCSSCGNKAKTTFQKTSLNSRKELKKRAVEECNRRYGTEFIFKAGKDSDDDIAEAILMGFSYLKESGDKNGV